MELPKEITGLLDGLTDVERDRVIEAQGWCASWLDDERGNRCLLGHAFNTAFWHVADARTGDPVRTQRVASAFDYTVISHGLPKTVAAVKARAARNHAPYSHDSAVNVASRAVPECSEAALQGVGV